MLKLLQIAILGIVVLIPNFSFAFLNGQKTNNYPVLFIKNTDLSEDKSYHYYSNLSNGKAFFFSDKISFVLQKEIGVTDTLNHFKIPIKKFESYRIDLEILNHDDIDLLAEESNIIQIWNLTHARTNNSSAFKKIIYRNKISGAELTLIADRAGILISIEEGFSFKINGASELYEVNDGIKIITPAGDITFSDKSTHRSSDKKIVIKKEEGCVQFKSISRSIEWATFLGGSSTDECTGIAYDSNNDIYVTGYSLSSDFPTTVGALQTTLNNQYDSFITKFDANGNLIWSTFYGGSDHDFSHGVKVNSSNKPVIAGHTASNNLYVSPTGVFQSNSGGDYDSFILQLNSNGSFDWATYFGGSSGDLAVSMAIDYADNILISGFTVSQNMPVTSGCFQNTLSGQKDAFIAKFNSTGNLLWSSYYGGTSIEDAHIVTTDIDGNVILSGETGSSDFPVSTGSFQPYLAGGFDIYLVKFSPTGLRLWSTYFGGTSNEDSFGLITDSNKNIYLTGSTSSNDFPLEGNSYQSIKNGIGAAYFSKFNQNGQLSWSTYYGGNGTETGMGLAMHSGQYLFSCGNTTSTDLPSIGNSFQPLNAGASDAYIVLLDTAGSFHYSSYLGGMSDDLTYNLTVNQTAKVLLCGYTYSTDFPVSTGAFQTNYGGDADAFVTKIDALNWLPVNVGKNHIFTADFSAYPNPALDKIFISGDELIGKEMLSVVIYDINGRQTINKYLENREKSVEINIKELKQGFYIISLINEGNHLKTTSFIKQ